MRKLRFLLITFGILFISLSLTSCKYKNKRAKYKTFELGFYPQDVVTSTLITDELDKISKKNSLGYYEYEGEQYAKLKCNPQYETDTLFRTTKTRVHAGEERYFKVMPITWRIMEETDEYLFLTTEYILFTKSFTNKSSVGVDKYANNYKESDIRKYLNLEFYQIYLESNEAIMQTEIDNSAASIDGIENNKYICENTFDYVSLISSADIDNKKYGFKKYDDRYAFASDYLIAQGATTNQESPNSFYFAAIEFFTRSPWPFDDEIETADETTINPDELVYCIDDHGMDNRTEVFSPKGIRPCIKVDKSKLV